MRATPLRQPHTVEQARQQAIDWQAWAGNQNLSYTELAEYQEYFKKIAKKFNLTDEFKENAII